jgi:hypothetical protein
MHGILLPPQTTAEVVGDLRNARYGLGRVPFLQT